MFAQTKILGLMKGVSAVDIYKITDLIKCDFYRIPKAFYSNPKYIKMSAEAKLAYAMLYDRLSLSQKNGWINDNGEVYLNFKRKNVAKILNVGEKKVTAIFRELSEKELIVDVCVGQGKPNRIYIVKPELSEQQAREYTDKENAIDAEITEHGAADTNAFMHEEKNSPQNDSSRTVKNAVQEPQYATADTSAFVHENGIYQGIAARTVKNAYPEPQKRQFQNRENDGSRTAEMTCQEPSEMRPNKTNINHIDFNYNSQSVITDRQIFNKILAQCQLECFDKEIRRIFYDAVERLFYCRELKIGSSVLPGENVRSRLCELDYTVLENALHKMHKNTRDTKNPTGYVMSVIFNCLTEDFTEAHLDPYLNNLRSG